MISLQHTFLRDLMSYTSIYVWFVQPISLLARGDSSTCTSVKNVLHAQLINEWNVFMLKVHGPIFQNLLFCFIWESSLQRFKFKISIETVKPFGCTKQVCLLQLPITYCVSLIMVTITRHIFNNIFQTEHFSAVKFAMGLGEK